MSTPLPISAIILTFNEENNIVGCLESIAGWCDEIFIVDSYSNDTTLAIARHFTGRIYQHPFENFSSQRNWAQENLPIKNEWLLHLDADERVSEELKASLKNLFLFSHDIDGLMAARKTIFRNRWIKYGGHYPVYHLRVFKKSKGKSEERFYDQHYMVRGKTVILKGDIVNIVASDVARWRMAHRKWAQLEACEILFNAKKKAGLDFFGSPIARKNWLRYKIYYRMPLFVRCLMYYLYRYLLRLGFLDGKEGMCFHYLHGLWYRVLVDYNVLSLRRESSVYLRNKCVSS